MKTSSILASTLLTFITLHSSAQELTNRILAKVNGKVITSFDVIKLTRKEEQQIQRTLPPDKRSKATNELRRAALDHLIDNELILKDFTDKQFKVPQTYLETRLEKVIAKEANGDRIKFNKALRKSNLTLAEYRAKLQESISVEMLINEMVKRKVLVSDSDINTYYIKNINAFSTSGAYKVQIIMLDADNIQNPQVIELSNAIKAKKDFTELAKKYNKNNGLPSDGKLGTMEEEDLRPEFLKQIKALNNGQTSTAITLEGKTYFLHLIERIGSKTSKLEGALKNKIRRSLEKQEEEKIYQEFIQNLRQRSAIEDYL